MSIQTPDQVLPEEILQSEEGELAVEIFERAQKKNPMMSDQILEIINARGLNKDNVVIAMIALELLEPEKDMASEEDFIKKLYEGF